jgi:hypothetical protein
MTRTQTETKADTQAAVHSPRNDDDDAVRALWDHLAARGQVSGERPLAVHTPWAIRQLSGAGGWLAALFLQLFLLGAVFVAARENAVAIAVCGAAMIGVAAWVYRVRPGAPAFEQFGLAFSLAGQGLAIYGASLMLGGERVFESGGFWTLIAAFQALLYVLVPNYLHRQFNAVGCLLAVQLATSLAGALRFSDMLRMVPWALAWMVSIASLLLVAFVLAEARLGANGWSPRIAPAADAGLLLMLVGALWLTATGHPLADLFWQQQPASVSRVAGVLVGVALMAFGVAEARRLGLRAGATMAVALAAAAYAALLWAAPAMAAGALGMGLALRRGSLAWLGLAIATIGLGFAWYYSALSWTLLAKSVTLAGAGVAVLLARAWLLRGRPDEQAGSEA